MKHTQEEIIKLAEKIFKELEYHFYIEKTIKAKFFDSDQFYNFKNVWTASAEVEDEQFPWLKSHISLQIDDDTFEPFELFDGSGGRIPPIKITKKNGKYQLGE